MKDWETPEGVDARDRAPSAVAIMDHASLRASREVLLVTNCIVGVGVLVAALMALILLP